jgi:hypothetical protein
MRRSITEEAYRLKTFDPTLPRTLHASNVRAVAAILDHYYEIESTATRLNMLAPAGAARNLEFLRDERARVRARLLRALHMPKRCARAHSENE